MPGPVAPVWLLGRGQICSRRLLASWQRRVAARLRMETGDTLACEPRSAGAGGDDVLAAGLRTAVG
jgi:hypothetical protein